MPRFRSGFTLLELLIVLGVVLILTAIALPNFVSLRTRGQVVMARSHTKSIVQGLDLYSVDHNRYPITVPSFPKDPFGILSHHQLSALTTPVAYISSDALFDPFGVVESQVYDPALSAGNDFPKLDQPNVERSLLYFHYPSMAVRREDPELFLNGASAVSIGPDRKDSLGSYRPFDLLFFLDRFPPTIASHPHDTMYQPTNGVRSRGDIGEYAGEARRFAVP
ncbi:MAG: type II secretion system protein [Candidatus Omnitrophica bacterium]|nr:type II secretion system protein [Candidatus Omnitrophota bacterium]